MIRSSILIIALLHHTVLQASSGNPFFQIDKIRNEVEKGNVQEVTEGNLAHLLRCFPRTFDQLKKDFESGPLADRSPLHETANDNNKELFSNLLKHGIGLQTRYNNIWPIVMHCYYCGKNDLLALLLENEGLTINQQAVLLDSRTLLHMAAYRCDVKMIEIALAKGADPLIVDCMGLTPLAMINEKFDLYPFLGRCNIEGPERKTAEQCHKLLFEAEKKHTKQTKASPIQH